ncbi:MAG: CHRD domain-containing protein [Allosphingosinicella sp.]
MRTTPSILLIASGAFALAACSTVADVVGDEYQAELTGAAVVPGPGDPNGWGRALVDLNPAVPQICTDLEVRDITVPATGAHIHRGAAGVSGPPVVTLDPPDDDDSDNCTTITNELAAQIATAPSDFYVQVHTSDHPQGAIRGQLRR